MSCSVPPIDLTLSVEPLSSASAKAVHDQQLMQTSCGLLKNPVYSHLLDVPTMGAKPLVEWLDDIDDPRRAGYALRHDLVEILVIAIAGIASGAENFEDVFDWATMKETWLRRFLNLPHGIPSADTLNRVFRLLDPAQFEGAFRGWVGGIVGAVEGLVAIDGKTVRGSADGLRAGIHVVSAYATRHGLSLGQVRVDEKSNEITAIPALLAVLDIEGCLISIDAMGCQKDIARQIVGRKADYLLAVKGNQPSLLSAVSQAFAPAATDALADAGQRWSDAEAGHGRLVYRECWVADNTGRVDESDWAGCRTLGLVKTMRIADGKVSDVEYRHYISSRPLTVEALADAVRGHWGIENGLHWHLDVTFGEDDRTVKKDHGPENVSLMNKIVLALLKLAPARKAGRQVSLRRRRLLAAWDDDERMALLGMRLLSEQQRGGIKAEVA